MHTGPSGLPVYNRFSDFLKARFGEKVYRITVDGGFSCPNRDKSGGGACTFCDERGSAARHVDMGGSLREQMAQGRNRMQARYGARLFIPYFQSFTNTYATADTCIQRYKAVLADDTVGLAVGTRPDCISDEVLDWLGTLSEHRLVIIDLGVQSLTDHVLKRINRGHDADTTWRCLERLARWPRIHTCVHLMFGLPGESADEMLSAVHLFAEGKTAGLKLHQLNILEGTRMAELYRQGQVQPMDLDRYADLVIRFLERIPAEVVVHRLAARADNHKALIAPEWGRARLMPIQRIVDEMERRDTWQGKFYGHKTD